MKLYIRVLSLSAALVLLVFLSLFYGPAYFAIPSPSHLQGNSDPGHLSPSLRYNFDYSKSGSPKITIIVIWSILGPTAPIYFPYFFRSVEANPSVDLLFVQVDRIGRGCMSPTSAPNVQDLCLSENEYYQLHVDFLCKRWQCTNEDKVFLHDHIKRLGKEDKNNSFFRILRNGIFLRWIDPRTTIWGWCDVDTFWGNFTRAFPWDIAHDFDIIAVASQPEFFNQRLLFTRGHMSFFRHSPDILDKLHSFPKFASLSAYLTLPPTRVDAEESEFSHFMFSDDETFTFLTIEGMENSYNNILLSTHGVLYTSLMSISKEDMTPEKRKRLLQIVHSRDQAPKLPSFTPEGVEKKTKFYRDCRYFEGSIWFDQEDCTYVETDWGTPEREQKAYIMRRKPEGPVLQRLESRERYLDRDNEIVVDEALYKHWQVEKLKDWFSKIPRIGLGPGQTFVQFSWDEAEIWNEQGEVIHETGP